MTRADTSKNSSSGEERQRRPLLTRVPEGELPGFGNTKRVADILHFVYELRAATAPMVEAVFFPPGRAKGIRKTHSNCQRYLRQLYHRGFLTRQEQAQTLSEGRLPLVYWLDRRGAEQLAINSGLAVSDLDWRPDAYRVGQLHLDHLLDTNWVRIAVMLAARQIGWTMQEWRDDLTLKREHRNDVIILKTEPGKKHRVEPDGYAVLSLQIPEQQQMRLQRFFLEVDRRTTTIESSSGHRDWMLKSTLYREYFQPGGMYEKRYGTTAGRVLVVTTGSRRLEHMKRITENLGGKSRYWFTTMEQATSQPILTAPIWAVAGREDQHTLIEDTGIARRET